MSTFTIRTVDGRGRINVGSKFLRQQMIVLEVEDGYKLTAAKTVPVNEAWLYEDPEALAGVMKGLAQAKAREFVEPPDIEDDTKLVDE